MVVFVLFLCDELFDRDLRVGEDERDRGTCVKEGKQLLERFGAGEHCRTRSFGC